MKKIKFKKVHKDGKIQAPSMEGDVGYNVGIVSYDIKSKQNEKPFLIKVSTGIKLEIPEGYYAEMVLRSSISKHSITIVNSVGIIDNGYRGEIIGYVFNQGGLEEADLEKLFHNSNGFFQLIFHKIQPLFELEEVEELEDSTRGEAGFGSTNEK